MPTSYLSQLANLITTLTWSDVIATQDMQNLGTGVAELNSLSTLWQYT